MSQMMCYWKMSLSLQKLVPTFFAFGLFVTLALEYKDVPLALVGIVLAAGVNGAIAWDALSGYLRFRRMLHDLDAPSSHP